MEVQNDLLTQCDIFHIAKHVMKHLAYSKDYDISFAPINMKHITNDLTLWLKGKEIKSSQLLNTFFFAPNINSFRRLKTLDFKDALKVTSDGTNVISVAAPDINLYLSMANLLTSKGTIDADAH